VPQLRRYSPTNLCDGTHMAIFCDFFLRPVFSASRAQHVSDLHSKFALRHIMCGSMIDIQSPTAESRRGKKEEVRKVEETTG